MDLVEDFHCATATKLVLRPIDYISAQVFNYSHKVDLGLASKQASKRAHLQNAAKLVLAEETGHSNNDVVVVEV